ncbi:hypothetical protein SAMN05216315_12024 [Nitrosospira sp. Nsp18]|nr:hypothetical protein SAMN05216315_12024 [Nitrosospira sp. Nsp18]
MLIPWKKFEARPLVANYLTGDFASMGVTSFPQKTNPVIKTELSEHS